MIIRFYPVHAARETDNESYLRTLTNGAWSFAHSILWKEQQFSNEELFYAKRLIRNYFDMANDHKKAFIAFCERVILTSRYISSKNDWVLPVPSIWLNRNYEYGFAGTKNWLEKVNAKRKEVPGYLKHINTLAKYFYCYIKKPSEHTFNDCRDRLVEQNAYSLLQHFYNTVIHYNYIKH